MGAGKLCLDGHDVWLRCRTEFQGNNTAAANADWLKIERAHLAKVLEHRLG